MLRAFVRNLVLDVMGLFSQPSKSIHILNGHYIFPRNTPKDAEVFKQLMAKLNKYYRFMAFEEACNMIAHERPVTKPTLCFSFDDGFKECSTIISPVLEQYGTNACFFINPSVIEVPEEKRRNFISRQLRAGIDKTFMTWGDIAELHKKGHCIGNHTYNHTELRDLAYEDAFTEVEKGKKILEQRLDYECKYFAIPFGTPSYFDEIGLKAATDNHPVVFTSSYQYDKYYYHHNRAVMSRRHFEGGWKTQHINYFLSRERTY